MDESGIRFLDKLYGNLYMSDVVQHTKENKDSRVEAIRKYLERLENLHKFATTESRKEYILDMYFDKYIIKEENIPYGVDKQKVIEAQKKRLKAWIDYLTDPTTTYPMWAKYWAFQGMLKMGSYDEAKGKYLTRNDKTIAPFIEPNPEIIAKSINTIIKLVNEEEVTEETEEKLRKTDSFSKIYTTFEKKFNKNTVFVSDPEDGIWIKYNQGSKEDAIKLSKSLENKNTKWCTASEDTAISQICGPYGNSDGGDFYVYYTKDKSGNYTIPRIAIRCDGHDDIAEIRGVADGQNLEDELDIILEKKLKEMTFLTKDSIDDAFEKINGLRELTLLGIKTEKGESLSNEEIKTLYSKHFGFGWTQDPRQEKIIAKRNLLEDFKKLDENTAAWLYTRLPDRSIDDVNLLMRLFKINPSSRVFEVATEKAQDALGRNIEFSKIAFASQCGIDCFKYFHKELQRRICSNEEEFIKIIKRSNDNLLENMKYFPDNGRTLIARQVAKGLDYPHTVIEDAENKSYVEIMEEKISREYDSNGYLEFSYDMLPDECVRFDFILDLIRKYDTPEYEEVDYLALKHYIYNKKTSDLVNIIFKRYPDRILEAIDILKPSPGTLANFLYSDKIADLIDEKPDLVAEIAKKYPDVVCAFRYKYECLLDHPEVVKEAIKSDCCSALEFIDRSNLSAAFEKDLDQELLKQSENDPLIPYIFALRSDDYMLGFLLRNPSSKKIMPPELWHALMYSDYLTINNLVTNELKKDPLAMLSRIGNPLYIMNYILEECRDDLPKELIDYMDDYSSSSKEEAYYRLIYDYKYKKKFQTL